MPVKRRKTKPLDRATILVAAFRLTARDGADALSMRRLASLLGIEAMSLYHHFPSKAAVLDAMVEVVAAEISPGRAARTVGKNWKKAMRDLALRVRRIARRHPKVFALVLERPSDRVLGSSGTERLLETLGRAGFGPEDALSVLRSLTAYVTGALLRELEPSSAAYRGEHEYSFGLERLIAGIEVKRRPRRSRVKRRRRRRHG